MTYRQCKKIKICILDSQETRLSPVIKSISFESRDFSLFLCPKFKIQFRTNTPLPLGFENSIDIIVRFAHVVYWICHHPSTDQ